MQNTNQILGHALRQARKKQNLSQEELAFRAGLDRTYISMLELGDNSPTVKTLVALCDALNLSLTDFATRFDAERARQSDQ